MPKEKEYLVFCETQYECYRGMAGVKARVWSLEDAQRAAVATLGCMGTCWVHVVNLTDGVYAELDTCGDPYAVDAEGDWSDTTLRELISSPQRWVWEAIPNWSSINAKHIEREVLK